MLKSFEATDEIGANFKNYILDYYTTFWYNKNQHCVTSTSLKELKTFLKKNQKKFNQVRFLIQSLNKRLTYSNGYFAYKNQIWYTPNS